LLWTTCCPRARRSSGAITRIAFVALTPFVPLSRGAGEGDYGVRKRSFRLMLKLTLQHSKNGCFPFSQAGEGDYGVRKRSFRLMLKLTLQHSKGG
jgi:hypothetical protein